MIFEQRDLELEKEQEEFMKDLLKYLDVELEPFMQEYPKIHKSKARLILTKKFLENYKKSKH